MTETSRTPSEQLAGANLTRLLKLALFSPDPPEMVQRMRVTVAESHALVDIGGRTIWAHSCGEDLSFRLVGEGWWLGANWDAGHSGVRAVGIVGDEEDCMNDLTLMRILL